MPGNDTEITRRATAAGPIQPGHYRVLVLESDLRYSHFDTPDLETAMQYASDAASETDDHPPLTWIFNHEFQPVTTSYGCGLQPAPAVRS